MAKELPIGGAFIESLTRNNKQIRTDRAIAISEDAQLMYKRKVEDLEVQLKRKLRDRENMLDLSPTDAHSLVLAGDFKSDVFVEKDIRLGVEIYNLRIQHRIAKEQYEELFVGKPEEDPAEPAAAKPEGAVA